MKNYFRIYRDHGWRLTILNLVHFCFVLPLLLVLYICVNAYTGILVGDSSVADVLPGLGFFMPLFSYSTSFGRALVVTAVILSALLFGLLKFVHYRLQILLFTGQYRFFSDILTDLRRRLPQAFALGLLDLLILARTITNLCGVYSFVRSPALSAVLHVFSLIVLLFWIAFRRWIYLLSAGCTLRLPQLFKYSFLLMTVSFGKTSQSTAVCALIWAIVFLTIPIVTVVLLPLCAYAATSLATVCCLYPIVQKQVLNKPDSA